MKKRYLIQDTTKEEREICVARVIGEYAQEDPEFSDIAIALYQYYIDGKLELAQIDRIMDMLVLFMRSEDINRSNVQAIADCIVSSLQKTCRNRLPA